MRARRAAILLTLLAVPAIGCPPRPAPAAVPSPSPPAAPSPAAPSPPAPAPPAPVGTASTAGSLEVSVADDRGRPVEGAVVWLQDVKPRRPVPSAPVVLEQRDLEFVPGFLVARKGQTLRVTNDDAELHNVHSSAACCPWNFPVVAGKADARSLDAAGEATLLCDIHSHMRCVLLVVDADFELTDAHGRARLEAPPGVHKLQVYALDRPRLRQSVEVPASGASLPVALGPRAEPRRVEAPEKLPWPVLAARIGGALAEAERWAALGDAASAREAAELANGRWYAGSGLYTAVRDLDAAEVEKGRRDAKGRADDLKSALRKCAALAEAAARADAASREAALAKLRNHDAKTAEAIAAVARELPKREVK